MKSISATFIKMMLRHHAFSPLPRVLDNLYLRSTSRLSSMNRILHYVPLNKSVRTESPPPQIMTARVMPELEEEPQHRF